MKIKKGGRMKYFILFLLMSSCISNIYGSVFYTGNRNDSKILKVDTESGLVTEFTDSGLLDHPIGLALNNDNSILYVSSGSNGKILQYDTATAVATELASGFRPPHAIVLDQQGYLYISQPGVDTVTKISPDGSSVTNFIVGGALDEPAGLAFDRYGILYVANATTGNIVKYSSDGTYLGVFASAGLTRPGVLYMDDDDNLYVADISSTDYGITKYSLDGTVLMHITDGIILPYGMGHDSEGNLYVADRTYNYIAKYNSSGELIDTITSSLFGSPGFIDFVSFSSVPIPEPLTCVTLAISLIWSVRRFSGRN